MINKVKKWLGIEGVKLELILPEKIKESSGVVTGKIRFSSMNEQKITAIKVKMVEKYSRGRSKEKLTDEYELGEITFNQSITIPKEKAIQVDFSLPFQLKKSEMDELADANIFYGGLVKLAKGLQGVSSEFYIQAEAHVKGTALHPFDKKTIKLE